VLAAQIQVVASRADVQRICLSTLAVERCRRPVGGNHGRDLLCGAVGDYPASAGHDDGADTTLNAGLGDRAVDSDRGVLLMVGVLTTNYLGTPSKIRYGPLPLRRRIGLCRLLPEFDGPVCVVLAIAISGIAGIWRFS